MTDLRRDPSRLGGTAGLSLDMPFQPVLDGVELPEPPRTAVERGSASGVPVLVGTNADEWNLFHLASPGGLDDPALMRRVDRLAGPDAPVVETYRRARPEATPDQLWCAVLTDVVFRLPAVRLLEAQAPHQPDHSFQYLFSWASRAFDGRLGACHALEIPFVFHTLDQPGAGLFLGDGPPPIELSLALHDAWIAFARHGDPGHPGLGEPWPAFDSDRRAVMELGDRVGVLDDPGSAERELWEGVIEREASTAPDHR